MPATAAVQAGFDKSWHAVTGHRRTGRAHPDLALSVSIRYGIIAIQFATPL